MDIKYKLYPYPVLWNKNDDYMTSSFDCEIKLTRDIKRFYLNVKFLLSNKELLEMIEHDLLEYALHIESPFSSYRTIKTSKQNEINIYLSDDNLLGKISLCPFIVAKQDLTNFYNTDWNPDYADTHFNIQKGAILAIGNGYKFSVDKETEDLSKVESIFTIYKRETSEEIPVEIEINSDKIRIGLNIKDYDNYAFMGTDNSINIINAFIIFPALIFTFEKVERSIEDYQDYRWFKALDMILKRYDMSLNESLFASMSSFELAQKIMSFPVSKALFSLNNIANKEN